MSSLSSTMLGAASALQAFQYALTVSQNNVGNATTPGYAKQIADLQAEPFNPAGGVSGGVSFGPLIDSRDLLAENDVWQQSGAAGDAAARNQALTQVENAVPISDGAGIPAALNTFFSDVSAWSAAPDDGSIRQTVMIAANSLAQAFNSTAAAVSHVSESVSQSIDSTVNQINTLTAQIAGLNTGAQNGGSHDAGMQAQLFSALETLSGLVDINVLVQPGGSVNVTMSGGAALVLGDQSYGLSRADVAALPVTDAQGPPSVAVLGPDGSIVNSQISSGTLHGLLEVRNVTISGLIGDTSQPGALNQLASTLAGRINDIVSQGYVSSGIPAPAGLFSFHSSLSSAAASSMALDPAMSKTQLPAIDSNGVANGVPLALAALASPQQTVDKIDTVSYTLFYGNAAAMVGTRLSQAQNDHSLAGQSLAQAQSMRQAQSGVSLDVEAVNVLQFQMGYQAVAKLVSTLDNLMQTLMNMIPT